MAIHGSTSWILMDIYGFPGSPWISMDILGYPWKPIESESKPPKNPYRVFVYTKCMQLWDCAENHSTSHGWRLHIHPRSSSAFLAPPPVVPDRYLRISMDIYRYPLIFTDIHGYPRISMDFLEYPLGVHGYPWLSMDFYRYQ